MMDDRIPMDLVKIIITSHRMRVILGTGDKMHHIEETEMEMDLCVIGVDNSDTFSVIVESTWSTTGSL